jgi:hypothetical protein
LVEVFDISASGEDRDGNYIENDKISVCVDAVQVGGQSAAAWSE